MNGAFAANRPRAKPKSERQDPCRGPAPRRSQTDSIQRQSALTPAFERIREPHRRRPRLERLGLAFMRRPGCKPHKVEGRAQAPVRIGEALGVDGASAKEEL